MSTNAKVPAVSPQRHLAQTLEKMKTQIAAALPSHIRPDYMVRVVMTACNNNPRLLQAYQSNPVGFLAAVMEASQLGLVPDGVLGMSHLVPYFNSRDKRYDVSLLVGYHGLMDLSYRSGRVLFIQPHTVHERDHFSYDLANMTIEHRPASGDRGPVTHYYATARVEGIPFPVFVVLSRADAEAHREKFSKSDDPSAPWQKHFDAMALKTCVRALCKWLPRSTELAKLERAAALDELAEAGIPQDLAGSHSEVQAYAEPPVKPATVDELKARHAAPDAEPESEPDVEPEPEPEPEPAPPPPQRPRQQAPGPKAAPSPSPGAGPNQAPRGASGDRSLLDI